MQDLIVDAHLDLAWNALQWNRDITRSVYTIRTQEAGQSGPGRGLNTVALPDMRRGKVLLCIATLMGRSTGVPSDHVDFRSPMQAYGIARGQLAYYRALEARGLARIITTREQLDDHIAGLDSDPDSQPIGMIISMESADSILEPADASDWFDAGVRLIGPAHYGMGRYAGGTGVEDGLTDIGFELLKQMDGRFGLDLTHLSDKAFWQALDAFGGRVIASHNNCRALVPSQRQFSDEQIKAIIARDGVIGVAFDIWMLEPGFVKRSTPNTGIGLDRIADHIDHICQLAGNTSHVGIGTDLDGGYGREQSPCDLDTIADLQNLIPLLEQRGYTPADTARILNQNWLRVLREILA